MLKINYVHAQKYQNARDYTDFRMKGRTAAALLRQAETWQRNLKKIETLEYVEWQRSGIGAFHLQEVDTPSESHKSWSIRELRSTVELAEEGRALEHCLSDTSRFNDDFSYAKRCYTGEISIWTMEMEIQENPSECRKVLTISVSLKGTPEITDISGIKNRNPTAEEVSIISNWAAQEGLEFDDAEGN